MASPPPPPPHAGAGRPWDDLPAEIVDAVVSHLDIFSAARLAAACTPWAKAVAVNPTMPFGMPCLLTSNIDGERCAFDVAKSCTNRHVDDGGELPMAAYVEGLRDQRWVGSRGSWIVSMDECCNARLVNPYTDARIDLPLVSTLPGITDPYDHFRCCTAISRIVLCEAPSPDGSDGVDEGAQHDYLAVAFVERSGQFLCVARGGDRSWIILKKKEDHRRVTYHDVIMHKGRIIAITRHGDLSVWNIRGCSSSQDDVLDCEPEILRGPKIELDDEYSVGLYYLAEIADGDRLLVACTFCVRSTYCRRAYGFRYETVEGFVEKGMLLFETDVADDPDDGGVYRWRRVTSLGNHSLFLGANYPLCVSFQINPTVPLWLQQARPECKCKPKDELRWQNVRPNCVIIALTGTRFSREPCDGAVYDLERETYDPVSWSWGNKDDFCCQDAMWFVPTLRDSFRATKAKF